MAENGYADNVDVAAKAKMIFVASDRCRHGNFFLYGTRDSDERKRPTIDLEALATLRFVSLSFLNIISELLALSTSSMWSSVDISG